MIITVKNQKNKLPGDGEPWVQNNITENLEQKKNTPQKAQKPFILYT